MAQKPTPRYSRDSIPERHRKSDSSLANTSSRTRNAASRRAGNTADPARQAARNTASRRAGNAADPARQAARNAASRRAGNTVSPSGQTARNVASHRAGNTVSPSGQAARNGSGILPSRNFIIAIVTALAAVAVVLLMVIPACNSSNGVSQGNAKSSSADSSNFTRAAQDASQQQASNAASGNNASSNSTTQTSGNDLSWRDSDFAVDPNRTDWNFADNGRKTIYLTIDDGPSERTAEVLDILDKYNAKATFFVVGLNPDYYPMIKEAYSRGHTIGLHSMTHDYATVYSSVDAYFADLDEIGQVVKEQIGYVPCFVRFPGGSSNAISANYTPGIMSSLVDLVQQRGYQYYDWNVSSGDGSDHTAEEIVGYATEPTEYENIVFLCHDSAIKQTTVEALPKIIEHYQALGYSFEALDRSSYVCHHGVSN